jgi:hypothetical protein
LDNCGGSVAADAPAFYRWFRCSTITNAGGAVTITTQDLPPHRSNYWGESSPNYEPFDTSRGPMYMPNPNLLAAQSVTITIPAAPQPRGLTIDKTLVDGVVGTSAFEYGLGGVGVATDSVVLFNPLAAPGMNIADEQYTFDRYNAHPEMRGMYHYHTVSQGPLKADEAGGLFAHLVGIMCDGTVILGCTELDGADADPTDFDAQNGHLHDLRGKDGTVHFTGRYHTHVCPARFTGHLYTPEIMYYSTCQR